MKRATGICLLAVIGLAGASALNAEDRVAPPHTPAAAPTLAPDILYHLRRIEARRLAARRAALLTHAPAPQSAAAAQPVIATQSASAAKPAAAPAPPVRRVSWGARLGILPVYPGAVIGQAQNPAAPSPAPATQGMYDSPAPAQPQAMPINPYKYAYAGRTANGTCYGTAYTSGYYTSGCFQTNACCRASRRLCTPFGGMSYGCTPGCYIPQTPPCPTACAYGYPASGTTAPPAYGTPTPIPATTSPPLPTNTPEPPPQPIEKKVTPEPQANLSSPRIPGLEPDA